MSCTKTGRYTNNNVHNVTLLSVTVMIAALFLEKFCSLRNSSSSSCPQSGEFVFNTSHFPSLSCRLQQLFRNVHCNGFQQLSVQSSTNCLLTSSLDK